MMHRSLPALVALSILACNAAAQSQPTPQIKPVVAKAATTAKAPTSKAVPTKKPTPAEAMPVLGDASEEQLTAFEMAHLGDYNCEFKQSVRLAPLAGKPGYLTVAWQKLQFIMKPVLSHTGALRLEDVTGRTLMIQIANKSMLMDTKLGQRLVDDCIHPEQTRRMDIARAEALANPASAPSNGLGITR